MYESLRLTITGETPLVMHNAVLADPLSRFSREISKIAGKRQKTEADYEEMGRQEFYGGLYLSGGEPCIPGEVLEAALIEGAKKRRRGPQAKAGILCDGFYPLRYDGPRDAAGLWADERFRLRTSVRVQRNRVIRTRPMFREWAADIEIKFMPSLLNTGEVRDFLVLVGQIIGIGDWRPRYGRFIVT